MSMGLEELMGFGSERIDLSTVNFTPDLLRCVPRHVARKYRALPIFESAGCLGIAIAGPPDLDVMDSLTHLLHRDQTSRVADIEQLDKFIRILYGPPGNAER